MATVKHHKVVAALPAALEPDAIYYVRAGQGHDVYVTNGSGMIVGYPANAALGLDGKVDKAEGQSLMTDAERAKLAGIEAGATANATDAQLRDRATHTGTQAIDTVSGLQAVLDEKIDTTERGVSGGVATLDEFARIPSSQLPSYVDDVLEFPTRDDFPATGEGGKIYIAVNQGTQANPTRQYRWTGSVYAEINPSPGTTDALAEGSTNLYFSEHRVRNTVLTGLSLLSSAAITAADTVLSALGKLQAQLGLKAPLDSPAFTGSPTAPTAAADDNDTTIANTAFVRAAMALFGVGAATPPATTSLDGLVETGLFSFENASTGRPFDYGLVLHLSRGPSDAIQIAARRLNSLRLAFRYKQSNVWSGWGETWHSGNFDPATKQDVSAPVFVSATRGIDPPDVGKYLRHNTASAIELYLGSTTTNFAPAGAEITIRAAGPITIVPLSGVVIVPSSGGSLKLTAGMTVTLKKLGGLEWDLIGQTVAA